MITHDGFVFVTPQGTYIKRSSCSNTTQQKLLNTSSLEEATVFPDAPRPSDSKNQDWSAIRCGREGIIVLPAQSRYTVVLRKV